MPYQVLHPLESGPDVAVYLVADRRKSGVSKVLTLLPFDLSQESQRLEFEALFTWRKSLDHPLLVPVYDFAFRGRRIGLVSELVEGDPVSKIFKTGDSWKQPRFLALQLAELLAYLHRREFLCGWMKPTQLFVQSEGRLKANFLVPEGKCNGGPGRGTWIRYCAPEFLTHGRVSQQTDLYSLGMVLYYLFTGHQPYVERDLDSLKRKQLVALPIRPRKLNPDVPSDIEQLIQDLIQKDPRVRPSSAEYVAAVLKKSGDSGLNRVPRFRSILVGREVELANFRRLSRQYLASPAPCFIAISGVSGIGKTSLMENFETITKIDRTTTYSVSHYPGSGALEVFTQLFNRIVDESETPISRIAWREKADPTGFAQKFLQLLTQVSNGRPMILCVDDLQWMDEGSLAIYRRIFESAELPIMVIGNYRVDEPPGYWEQLRAELGQRKVLTEFSLRALEDQKVRDLMSNLLGDIPSEDLFKQVLSQCAGNPFYIYEFLRFLRETDELSFHSHSGHWQWQPRQKNSRIPGTVIENIRARLQGIGPVHSQLLEYLSVLERPVRVDWLAQILKMQVIDLGEGLTLLDRLDFVSISGSLDQPVVLLSHDWLGRVLRSSLAVRKRKAMHARIAGFLEAECSKSKYPPLREALVRHFLGAGDGSKVRKHIWEVIEWLEQRHLYKVAAELVGQALKSKALPRGHWKCVRKAAELFYLAGELDKCVSLSKRFLSESPQLADGRKAFIYWLLARAYLIKGRAKVATRYLEQALPLLKEGDDEELFAEVQGHLLCCLTSLGEYARAEKMAKELLHKLSKDERSVWVSKQCHALCYYHGLRGDVRGAVEWEVRSIQAALKEGKLVPSTGRIQNLAFFNLEIGRLILAEKLARYSLQLADEIENHELVLYARGTLCCVRRKLGQHQKANCVLLEIQSINQRSNRNAHIEAELYIELAKNSTYQLLPERALFYLKKCRDILGRDAFHHSSVDATLALAWTWVVVGRPNRALKVVSSLNLKKILRQKGRYFLLLSQAHMMQGDHEQAWQDVCQAYDSFPDYMLYFRARARLAQGKVLLEKAEFKRADRYIQEALSIAKDEFYFPLMVEGMTLHAKGLCASGNPSLARAYCLRALQLTRRVDRPGSRAEVCRTLGKIESALGNREGSIQRYSEALQILKERLLYLSPDHRQSFSQRFILPIESDRDRLLPGGPGQSPSYLVQLRQLANMIRETVDQEEIGKRTLRIVGDALPAASANILLRKFPGGPFYVAASQGHCQKTGKHLLTESWNGEHLFLPEETRDVLDGVCGSLGIPLRSGEQLLGLLYLERGGREVSEDEIDFLSCVASIVEIPLASRAGSHTIAVDSRHSLSIDKSRTIVGQHPRMRKLFEEVRRVALSDSTVLIWGDSGTGKELVARGLHSLGDRQGGPFIPINCSALPDDLIESELFGHRQGSFTGAVSHKPGLFEAASGGTLFLDEIATMPIHLQTRLLRVLDDRKIRRLGETKERPIDVRIVAATNQPLKELIRRGEFREDLYHRLNVYQIRVPCLQEHISDIPLLTHHILEGLNRRTGQEKGMTDQAISLLSGYAFPGNVRELENIIESAYHFTEESMISMEDITWRLDAQAIEGRQTLTPAESIVEDLVGGRVGFWRAVRDPFLKRDLSRDEVREIISTGLSACNGKYRRVVEYFNLPDRDYKRFLAFLSNHNCKVDFRRFRKSTWK